MFGEPITDFIRAGMQTYKSREDQMRDRVAECAINSQKIVDEHHGPHKAAYWWRDEQRSRALSHLYVANSAMKGLDEGCVSSFKASRYYSNKAAERRDALLEKIRNEEAAAS
eukprot:CAMPEP_0197433790 /NCGR_PEP_ID=MMETSP1175-20131217/1602_1 /TAXON_ID=1003142 /ORGANISM="Triceratium dubium, Strain CCMP147" /LENGTH=111 /DNA_ID=CAMNT_0042962275 /DNA_START=81 /DNA_END=416 /DNA_ORIENTATION=+